MVVFLLVAQIFHNVAREVMDNRIENVLSPRQICEFLYQFGSAKVLFPFVFDRCVWFLLRMNDTEKSNLDWILNRMEGRIPRADGLFHLTNLPKSYKDLPLDFQIGAWDSHIFVGSTFSLLCQYDAEMSESSFWSKFLENQLSMSPKATLDKYPMISIDSISYPLFAMQQFERSTREFHDERRKTISVATIPERVVGDVAIQHPEEPPSSFARVIVQTLEGLTHVSYLDELLLKPLGQLLAESHLHPFRRRKKVQSNRRQKKHQEIQDVRHDRNSNVRLTGISILSQWNIDDLLTVFTAFTRGRVRVPPGAITALTEKLFYEFRSLRGQQLSQLIENITQSCRGKKSDLIRYLILNSFHRGVFKLLCPISASRKSHPVVD